MSKVVSKTKNKEIPSIPKFKLTFRRFNQVFFVTNWNDPIVGLKVIVI
jgi:hypothetical protein